MNYAFLYSSKSCSYFATFVGVLCFQSCDVPLKMPAAVKAGKTVWVNGRLFFLLNMEFSKLKKMNIQTNFLKRRTSKDVDIEHISIKYIKLLIIDI